MPVSLSAGTALRDISPKQGVRLGGYPHHPRPNKGIHDPLYAACLYLTDGTLQMAMITMDIISFSKRHVQTVRERVFRQTGIPQGNIMICCSHSHSAPRGSANMTMDAYESDSLLDEDFVEMVITRAAEAAAAAKDSLFPAKLGIEKGFCGREQGVGGNRREPMGISNPEVWTIGVQDMEGTMRAVLVSYALHPTFLHSDNFLVSADYPGYIRTYIANKYPHAVFLFAQGTSGNQSPRFFRSGKTFDEAQRVGEAIGKAAESVLASMEYRSDIPLKVHSQEIEIELRRFPEKQEAREKTETLRKAWHTLRDAGAPERDVWVAELMFLGAEDTLSMLMLHEEGKLYSLYENTPMEVQVLSIGDARIACLPGEIFVEFGITIQYRSPFPKTFVIELANGTLPGYAATAKAYAEGGYETGASMLTGRSGEQLTDAAVELLHKSLDND